MTKEESKLEKLKKNYEVIRKKYDLPDFKKLNEDFQIEKAADIETEILIREVRRFIADKLGGYMRFIETLLNPVNAPMFVFSIIKTLGANERKKLSEVYKKLTKNEIDLIRLDTEFSEGKEAEYIKSSYKIWQEIKRDFLSILDKIDQNLGNKSEMSNKSYFG